MIGFELAEREFAPGCHEIRVIGELDLSVADRLKEALERVLASGCERLLIGLDGCEFIDSTGIATIVQAHSRMAQQGRQLLLYAPSEQVGRVLAITGLRGNGMVFETVDQALAAMREPS